MTETRKETKTYERKRGETQCPLCSIHCRSDRLVAHLLTHKHNLTDLLNPKCRADAIQRKMPMIYYHLSAFTDPKDRKRFDENKMFCACLICGKGKYAGGHGSTHDFVRIHSQSDCVKQWDSVAHLFGELPVDTPPLPQAPAPQETAKDRLIQSLRDEIAELKRDAEQTGKRFNELWKENEQRKTQPQPPKAPEPFRVAPDPTENNPLLPERQEIPNEPEPEPEPQPPTLVVVPTEPEPMPNFATLPLATVRKDPNEGKPGYFQAKSGKWLKKITGTAPPPPAPDPQQSNLLETQATTNHTDPNEGRDGYFLARSGKWVRRIGGAMPRPTTTLLAVKPPPAVPKAPTLTLNIDDILAQLNAPPTDAEKAEMDRENEEFQINEILNGIVEHEWTADETKDYISEREEEMNLTAVLKRRCLNAILRFADGEDNFEEIAEIQRA